VIPALGFPRQQFQMVNVVKPGVLRMPPPRQEPALSNIPLPQREDLIAAPDQRVLTYAVTKHLLTVRENNELSRETRRAYQHEQAA